MDNRFSHHLAELAQENLVVRPPEIMGGSVKNPDLLCS
jgi:hypothetical protein